MILNLKQFDQLVEYIPLLKRSFKKKSTTRTLPEYGELLQQQTQFLIGNNVYVAVTHLQDESKLQFIEYHVIPSLIVPGQKVVCPSRLCMSLDVAHFQELVYYISVMKIDIKKLKKKVQSKPDYASCLPSQKYRTRIENGDFVTDV